VYIALALDAVSVAFQGRAAGLTQQTIMISTITAATRKAGSTSEILGSGSLHRSSPCRRYRAGPGQNAGR
jgi:hypothetical protein